MCERVLCIRVMLCIHSPSIHTRHNTHIHSFSDSTEKNREKNTSEITNKKKKIIFNTQKKITMLSNVIRCAYVEHFFKILQMILLLITKPEGKKSRVYLQRMWKRRSRIQQNRMKSERKLNELRAALSKQATNQNDVAKRNDNSKITPSKIDYSSKKFSI